MKVFLFFCTELSFFYLQINWKKGTARPNIVFAIPDRRLENAILIRVKENRVDACWDLSYEIQVKFSCDENKALNVL
jgi:hypothetical protein